MLLAIFTIGPGIFPIHSEQLLLLGTFFRKGWYCELFPNREIDFRTLTFKVYPLNFNLQTLAFELSGFVIIRVENELEETTTLMTEAPEEEIKRKKEEFDDYGEEETIAPQVMLNENGEVVLNDERFVYGFFSLRKASLRGAVAEWFRCWV